MKLIENKLKQMTNIIIFLEQKLNLYFLSKLFVLFS